MNTIATNIAALPQTNDPAKLFAKLFVEKLQNSFGEGSYSANDIEQIKSYGNLIFLKSDRVEKVVAYVNLFFSTWQKRRKPQSNLLDRVVDGKQYNFID
jgi:hypothetical protein